MHTNDRLFPSELIEKIVCCVEEAVGDDILSDIQVNNLRTTNSVPSRIWDLMNTNLIQKLDTADCTIAIAHRGPWQMIIIFEKSTQCIITFMREKRFSELQKRQHSRVRMHYLDMLTKQFNNELLADQQQIALFPHSFSDEDRLAELVQTLLHDLQGDVAVVRNHVLVLFETVGFQLTHIRAVKVTPDLEIAQNSEQDWSKYISANESFIVDKVAHHEAPENKPNRGLALKPKALARKKDRPHEKKIEKEAEKES